MRPLRPNNVDSAPPDGFEGIGAPAVERKSCSCCQRVFNRRHVVRQDVNLCPSCLLLHTDTGGGRQLGPEPGSGALYGPIAAGLGLILHVGVFLVVLDRSTSESSEVGSAFVSGTVTIVNGMLVGWAAGSGAVPSMAPRTRWFAVLLTWVANSAAGNTAIAIPLLLSLVDINPLTWLRSITGFLMLLFAGPWITALLSPLALVPFAFSLGLAYYVAGKRAGSEPDQNQASH